MNQIQSSLEICLVETIRTVAPVATARATTRVQATTTTSHPIVLEDNAKSGLTWFQ